MAAAPVERDGAEDDARAYDAKVRYGHVAGKTSKSKGDRDAAPQFKKPSLLFNSQVAAVDDLLYGEDLDEQACTVLNPYP